MAMDPEDMEAVSAPSEGRYFCPLPGCIAHGASGHAGWESFAGLKAHMDGHQLGVLPGAPPEAWLRTHQLVGCRECSGLVSRRRNGGVHRTCMAARLSAQPAAPMAADGAAGVSDALLASLPSLDEIFAAPVATRGFVAAGLLPQARKEFLRCVANVVQHNCLDDWERDTMATRRCRLAWTELFMFPKTCLAVLPGGRAKGRRNHNVTINRLERWGLGERRALWDEAVGKPRRPRGHVSSLEERQVTAVVQLARRGMPGKAMQRLSGAPVAKPTPEIVAAMRSKFPPRPAHQHSSSRPPAPPANEVSVEDVIGAVKSFPRGAAPGPTGLRSDFLKQIVGDGGDVLPGAHLLTSLVNLLADGRAPAALRPYLGGAQGTALEKTSKTGHPDVRPLCAGEALRRLVGKVLLRSELPVLREHLLPYQLAVGVPAGVEVMPHLHRQWRTTFSADADRVCLSYDESNAHNVVDRHAFLTRMREVVPGVSRWLEYIYPTHQATKVFFHNVIIDSVAGEQQGCPLMMACHAVVQRMLLESLGLVPPLVGSSVSAPVLHPPVQLDIAPCFADDGLLAGPSGEVLRALQHWQGVLPQLGLRLSSAVVAPAAPFSHVDFQPFLSLGCHIAPEGNYEVLKSPSGSDAYCRAFCTERADRQIALLQRL